LESGNTKKPVWKTNPNKPATEKQIHAIEQRGGEIWENMTQKDIEEQFKLINQAKNTEQKIPIIPIDIDDPKEAEKLKKEFNKSKILTKKQIEELEEESLL